jgi:hypothetical protein
MSGRPRLLLPLLILAAALGGGACRLERPEIVPTRMIEPRLADTPGAVADAPDAVSVRLLETQTRGHLGRAVLHQLPSGELTADPVWRWTSTPDRYLDSALRLALAARSDVQLVDRSTATALALTLLSWHLDAGASPQLVGAIELQLTGVDRAIRTEVIRASEPVTPELPGDLADAAGRLLQRLATDSLARLKQAP